MLDDIVRRQLPFATAVALTRVAIDSQAAVRSRLGETFRGPAKQGRAINPRIAKGIRVKPASKGDWPHPEAQVGVLDEFMALHATGGVKRPKAGSRHIAVPTRLVKRMASGAVPSALKPRPFRNRPSVFVEQERGVDRRIRQRFNARKRAELLRNVGTFYHLVTSARIARTWPVEAQVGETVARTYAGHLDRELTAAVRSARSRSLRFTSELGRTLYLSRRGALGRIPTAG